MSAKDYSKKYEAKMNRRRIARAVMYFFLALAGAFATFGPPTLIENQVRGWVAVAWALCLFGSGCTCLYGAVTDRWIGEYTGLPLMFSVLFLFGASLLLSARETGNFPVYAYGFVVLAFANGLLARWQDVGETKNGAESLGSEGK